jgi:hypothetical protein
MKVKSILISEKTHETLKKFCKENSLILGNWVDKVISEVIKEKDEKKDRK